MDNQTPSKVLVYEDGGILDLDKVKELLFAFWKLTETERRSLSRMIAKYPSCPNEYKEAIA